MKHINAKVYVGNNESIDSALRKFNTKVQASGIMQELKDRACYLKPSRKKRLERLRNKFKGDEI